MTTQTDIEIVQGETKNFSATWTKGGVAQSLADYVAHLQVRKRAGSYTAAPMIDVSSTDAAPAAILLEPGGQTGKVVVRIPATLTRNVARNGWYDLFIVKASDPTDAVRLMHGQVTVSKSATDNSTLHLQVEAPVQLHVIADSVVGDG